MATFDVFKNEGMELFGEVGAWAFAEWKTLNTTYFGGKNKAGRIIWGSNLKDNSLGYYFVAENLIYLHKNLMRPFYPSNNMKWGILHLNKKLASDVLLHEMIHQMIHQTGGWEGEDSHNNNRFVQEVNRIAKLLGLDVKAEVIKQKKGQEKVSWPNELGYLTLKELSHFPYSSRPYEYYYGRP